MTTDELAIVVEGLKAKVAALEGKEKLYEKELVLSAWTKIVDTQMHFNEMATRVRNFAITLILAVFGAAAYSLQSPVFISVDDRHVHIAFFIIAFGLVGWFSLFLLDVHHFHRLLRGAVEHGMALEDKYKNDPLLGHVLGMTTAITKCSRTFLGFQTSAGKKVGFKISAGKKVSLFYLLVLAVGIIFCGIVLQNIHKDNYVAQQKEQIIKVSTDTNNGILIRVEQTGPKLPTGSVAPDPKPKNKDSKK